MELSDWFNGFQNGIARLSPKQRAGYIILLIESQTDLYCVLGKNPMPSRCTNTPKTRESGLLRVGLLILPWKTA